MFRLFVSLVLGFVAFAFAKDDQVVFKSDVALTRVDAQVLDRDGRAITGLQANDFVLRVDGKTVPVRNFESENMPLDVLLLLDVSGSMEPHIQRIASASQQALNVLADKDRVAIMVFDTSTRLRLPFRNSHEDVTRELNRLLRSESFKGGTRITRALLKAADYMQQEARPEARRAIVILTDDETQDEEDEARVESALNRSKTVLSFLQAPYEPPVGGMGRRRGGWGRGGTWPGGGGGWPGGGGGPVILGPRGPGGYGGGDRSHSAGTATIAGDSGGDTMNVERASALEDTLSRLRQRYALHFYVPDGSKSASAQSVRVELSQQARIRYPDAEVRSRRVFMSGGTGDQSAPVVVSHAPAEPTYSPATTSESNSGQSPDSTVRRRRVAVNDGSTGPQVDTVGADPGTSSSPGTSSPTTTAQPATPPASGTQRGWPRADQQTPKQN